MTCQGWDPGPASYYNADFDFHEMEALQATSGSPIHIKSGDVVESLIVRIDRDEILVDTGLKNEGILSKKELPISRYGSFNDLHLNGKILVYVIQPEAQDGHALLALKRPNAESQWRIAEHKYGLIVDVAGIRGFAPISQILNLKREEVY